MAQGFNASEGEGDPSETGLGEGSSPPGGGGGIGQEEIQEKFPTPESECLKIEDITARVECLKGVYNDRVASGQFNEANTTIETLNQQIQDFIDSLNLTGEEEVEGGGGGLGGLVDKIDTFLQGGGGGGSGKQDPIIAQLNDQLNDILLQLKDLSETGALPDLDEETKAQLDTILEQRLGEAEFTAETEQSQLIAALFGRGIQESTFAIRAATDLTEAQERIRQGILAQDAALRLDFRQSARDAILASLNLMGSILTSQQQVRLGELGIAAEKFIATRNQQASILGALISRDATIRAATISSATQLKLGEVEAMLSGLELMQRGILGGEEIRLGEEGLRLQEKEINLQAQFNQQQLRQQRRDSFLALLGTVALGFAKASDRRLKKNIRYIGSLFGLRFYRWSWTIKTKMPAFGLIAQDLPKGYLKKVNGFYFINVVSLLRSYM